MTEQRQQRHEALYQMLDICNKNFIGDFPEEDYIVHLIKVLIGYDVIETVDKWDNCEGCKNRLGPDECHLPQRLCNYCWQNNFCLKEEKNEQM